MTVCACENETHHDQSPGLIADGETVCRGAFDPVHFNKSGLKEAFIRPAHLLAGELSIWRISRDPDFGIESARERLEAAKPEAHTLKQILAAEVGRIRSIRLESIEGDSAKRAFCVVDDCTTTAEGGWHPLHAAIKLAVYEGFDWEGTDEFSMAKEGLMAVFKQSCVWPQAA